MMQLRADDLACNRGGREVFRGLSFSLAAGEAIVGLLIEITFIATFTQRFFGK